MSVVFIDFQNNMPKYLNNNKYKCNKRLLQSHNVKPYVISSRPTYRLLNNTVMLKSLKAIAKGYNAVVN
jgi:hypothetical protein